MTQHLNKVFRLNSDDRMLNKPVKNTMKNPALLKTVLNKLRNNSQLTNEDICESEVSAYDYLEKLGVVRCHRNEGKTIWLVSRIDKKFNEFIERHK